MLATKFNFYRGKGSRLVWNYKRCDVIGIPRVLLIAGSDSGGGAGIQADLKTVSAFGVFGMTVLTAVTAQNTIGVFGVNEISAEFVAQQIDVCVTDIGFNAAKTGMFATTATVEVVADRVNEHSIRPLVVDPVLASESGRLLLKPHGLDALKTLLLPLVHVITPNLDEAVALTGLEVRTLSEMKNAARVIHDLGPENVVMKGGHLDGDATDLLFDGTNFHEFRSERINTQHTHGTG